MSDQDKLRTAIALVRDWSAKAIFLTSGLCKYDFDQICDAAASTLPKSKIVEVWVVWFAKRRSEEAPWEPECMPMTEGEVETRKEAAAMENDPMYAHIRVTGPHKQEIPA